MEPSYGRPTAGVMTFGGNIQRIGGYFPVNGTAASILENVYGTYAVVGVTSYPFAVTWDTASGMANTTLQLLRNEQPIAEFEFLMEGASGTRNFQTPIVFAPGNLFQLRYVSGMPPGQSVVSFYMTPA